MKKLLGLIVVLILFASCRINQDVDIRYNYETGIYLNEYVLQTYYFDWDYANWHRYSSISVTPENVDSFMCVEYKKVDLMLKESKKAKKIGKEMKKSKCREK